MSDELAFTAKIPFRPFAVSEAILAKAIWASLFVFVKIALPHMGPLTIAALRYFLAFLGNTKFYTNSLGYCALAGNC